MLKRSAGKLRQTVKTMEHTLTKGFNTTGCMILLLLGMNLAAFQSLLNVIALQYDLDIAKAGLLVSVYFTGILTAPVFAGEVSDRIGKVPVLAASMVTLAAGLLCISFSATPVMLYIGIFVSGCGAGVTESTVTGLLADNNQGNLTYITNFSQMFFTIGALAGPLAALSALKTTGGWRSFYIVLLLLIIAALIFLLKYGAASKDNSSKASEDTKVSGNSEAYGASGASGASGALNAGAGKEKIKTSIIFLLVRQKKFLLFLLMIFIYVGAESATAFWMTEYFDKSYGAADVGSIALSGYWGIMIPGRFMGSRLKNCGKTAMAACLGLAAAALPAALISGNIILTAICFVLTGFGFSIIWPVLMSMACAAFPRYTGSVTGGMMVSGAAGGMAIPFIVGLTASGTGLDKAMWLLPFAAVLLLILTITSVKDTGKSCERAV